MLIALILVGLWFIGYLLGLDRYVRAPVEALREVWLPLLFVLVYILIWLGWTLWKLLGPDQLAADFPDIDKAWEEGVEALVQAGINLTDVPVYLVLGRPIGAEKALFNAAELKLQVKQVPRDSEAPLTVSANQDAVYVTCAGASLLGRYATLLAGGSAAVLESARSADEEARAESGPVGGERGDLATEPKPATSVLVAEEEEDEPFPASPQARPSLLKDTEELERQTARLRYLCQRIARDRRPFCPVNGSLLLVPLSATDGETAVKETSTLAQGDLTAAREALQVQAPIFVMVCDMERAAGFGDFLAFFPEGQRRRYLGQQFPLAPDLDASARVRMVEKGVQWVGSVLIPSLVYKSWGVEGPERGAVEDVIARNVRLYRFLWDLRERQKRLGRILTRAVVMHTQGATMLGGCCFAATGRDRTREQGFAAAVFRLLNENQNFVAWTPEALAAESEYRRWTNFGYAALGILCAGLLALGIVLWLRR